MFINLTLSMETEIPSQNTRPSIPSVSGHSSRSPYNETQLIRKIEKWCLKTKTQIKIVIKNKI